MTPGSEKFEPSKLRGHKRKRSKFLFKMTEGKLLGVTFPAFIRNSVPPPPPQLSECILFAMPDDARAIFLLDDLLLNDT